MKTRFSLLIPLLSLLGLALADSAQARPWNVEKGVEVEIIDDHGQELRQYPVRTARHTDSIRAYIAAEQSKRYAIRVRNHSPYRVGLVIAVDGRNIISGKQSYLEEGERMYILGPHDSAVYKGWRTSRNRVHRFFFTDAADSYADAFDDRSAMGVIAVAVYREKARIVREYTPEGFAGSPVPPSKSGRFKAFEDSEPGTGFGESKWSPSRQVHFEPEHRPIARYFIKYEWRKTLCRKGVISCRPELPHNRFWPYKEEEGGFAPYPPGREYHWNHSQ